MQVTRAADTSSATNTSVAQALAGNQTLGQDEFLKLLVTQLTNQDPTSPQDDKEFLAQMAQFSTVEGVNEMSKTVANVQATSLLGKTVSGTETSDGSSTPVTGVVESVIFSSDGVRLKVGDYELKPSEVGVVE